MLGYLGALERAYGMGSVGRFGEIFEVVVGLKGVRGRTGMRGCGGKSLCVSVVGVVRIDDADRLIFCG